MPFSERLNQLLHLGASVRLPISAPKNATLEVATFVRTYDKDGKSIGIDPEKTVLLLTHKISDRLDVSRYFRLSDVRAAYAVWAVDPPAGSAVAAPATVELKLKDEVVKFVEENLGPKPPGDESLSNLANQILGYAAIFNKEAAGTAEAKVELAKRILNRVNQFNSELPPPKKLTAASVYLPESASVVLHADAALSAAESAEYYPPASSRARVLDCDPIHNPDDKVPKYIQ